MIDRDGDKENDFIPNTKFSLLENFDNSERKIDTFASDVNFNKSPQGEMVNPSNNNILAEINENVEEKLGESDVNQN